MKMSISKAAVALSIFTCCFPWISEALTLDEYLEQVQKKNRALQSLEASQEAANDRYKQGDLVLSPVFTAATNSTDDKSLQYSSSGLVSHMQARQTSLGIAKKFSTGTQVSVQGSVQALSFEANTAAGGAFAQEFHTGTLGVSLSQSLWKDFFGSSTRLRWEREKSQQKMEKTGYDLQARQALIRAEAAFWDLFYLQQEVEIRKESLDRARRIEGWVRRRAGNGIGDRADVLNAQGLVAARELQLLTSQDELIAAQKVFGDQLELPAGEPIPKLQGNLDEQRPLESYVGRETGRVVRLDSYLDVLNSQVRKTIAGETAESLRPDLVLQGQYKTNGYDTTDAGAASRMTDSKHPVASVGVSFTWLLDWETKNSVRNAASQDALAAQLKKERSLLESDTSWREVNRRYSELSRKIKAAQSLAEIQSAKAKAERDKFSKGRSITSNVITAEQDAADSLLTMTKLKAEQRKLEAQGRLFVKIQEGT